MRQRWLLYAGLAFVFVILGCALAPFPAFSDACALAAGIMVIGAIVVSVRPRRDKYSLEALREEQERAELEAIEVPDLEFDSVRCMCCGRDYHPRFPICPHCKVR